MSDSPVQPKFSWNDIYTGDGSDLREADPDLLSIAEKLPPGRALDVGCGAGGMLLALAKLGWDVCGVDIAPRAIVSARSVLAAHGYKGELVTADASEWNATGEFDLIVCSFALPDTREAQAKLFPKLQSALAKGGTVVIKDFDASMRRFPEFAPYHCPTLKELEEGFAGLHILRSEVAATSAHNVEGSGWTAALFLARRL